jgi:hypothetical protein
MMIHPFEQMKLDSERDWQATLEFFKMAKNHPEGGSADTVSKLIYRAVMGFPEDDGVRNYISNHEWNDLVNMLHDHAVRRGEKVRERRR